MWFLNRKVTVAVHDGHFHADDVFAAATVSTYLNQPIEILRTRDTNVINAANYVLDVGREYDPKRNKFDHHQDNLTRPNSAPYASFGLVWKEFGEKITGSKEAQKLIDDKLVQAIDAIDNAVDLNGKLFDGVKDYSVSDYVIYQNFICNNNRESDKVFNKLVIFAKELIQTEILIARKIVENRDIIMGIYKTAKDKRIIVLDEELEGWNEILSDFPEPLFVIRPMKQKNSWKVSCVKVKGEKFKNRLSLPEKWAGKIDNDLALLTGVPDALYCHHQKYMAIVKTKDGAIKFTEQALREEKK